MSGRAITNLLLAIIAGVLLFGQSTMNGILKVVFVAGVVVLALVLAYSGLIAAINAVIKEWNDAKTTQDKAMVVGGTIMLPVLAVMALIASWHWLQGTPRPLQAAMDGPVGTVWSFLVALLLVGVLTALLWRGGERLVANRRGVPAVLRKAGLYYLIGLVAVVALPVQEWRNQRADGAGVIPTTASSTIMMLVGFFVNMAAIGAGVGLVAVLLHLIGF